MARETGGSTIAGFKIASTHGTAVQAGAGDGLCFNSLTASTNPTELSAAPLGCGLEMLQDAKQGALSPGGTVESNMTYGDAMSALIAAFFGSSPAPVEQNGGEGDYLHTMSFLSQPLKFGTLAYESTTTTTIEYTSVYPTALNISIADVPAFPSVSVDWIANARDLSSSTNTNATLSAVTRLDEETITAAPTDDFWLANDALALDSGDQVNIISYDLSLTRAKEFVREIKGSAGLPAPKTDGLFAGTLSVTLSGLDDHTYFTSSEADEEWQCKLSIEGSQIGAGNNRELAIYLPKMKLIEDPEYNVTEEGENVHVLNFLLLAASTPPAGQPSSFPAIELTNEKSTAYLP